MNMSNLVKFKSQLRKSCHKHLTYILRSQSWVDIKDPTERLERGLDYIIDNVAKDLGYVRNKDKLIKLMLWEFVEMQLYLFTIVGCEDIQVEEDNSIVDIKQE